ncbi:MAG: hypothetical protein E7376_01885 [Clostridiales bacterium]|nr:hypothetical protein [Clostridiales bacterium]
MPKATIRTYGNFNVNGTVINVSKITCEDANIANIEKEVSFGKYSKKLPLHGKVKNIDLGRE